MCLSQRRSIASLLTCGIVRKAYKRRALATHPDRLPQNVTDAEKAQANEQFRLVSLLQFPEYASANCGAQVNNAYEVLNDSGNRKVRAYSDGNREAF